jgi:hypothetical protein
VEFAIRRRVLAKRVDHGFLEFLLRLKQIDLRGLFW